MSASQATHVFSHNSYANTTNPPAGGITGASELISIAETPPPANSMHSPSQETTTTMRATSDKIQSPLSQAKITDDTRDQEIKHQLELLNDEIFCLEQQYFSILKREFCDYDTDFLYDCIANKQKQRIELVNSLSYSPMGQQIRHSFAIYTKKNPQMEEKSVFARDAEPREKATP